jgi:hypothetical protein
LSTEPDAPTEEELRAAYEAELNRISATDMILQAAASLLNIGAHRLGLTGQPTADQVPQRDLEQVRDAIDGVRGLLPVLERRAPRESRPLRDALSQLQLAYAREASDAPASPASAPQSPTADQTGAQPAEDPTKAAQGGEPGPAQASGRLWVPGR